MNGIDKSYLVCDKKGGFFRFLKFNLGEKIAFKKSKSFVKIDDIIFKNFFGVVIFYYDEEDVLDILKVINLDIKNILICSFDNDFLSLIKGNESLKTLHLDKLNEELKIDFNFIFNFN